MWSFLNILTPVCIAHTNQILRSCKFWKFLLKFSKLENIFQPFHFIDVAVNKQFINREIYKHYFLS